MPKKYDQEIKARAVRMVRDHLSTYGSVTKAAEAVGPQLGISGNTLRGWEVQADVDDGVREGVPSEVQAELARLTAENRRLRETNEILRSASAFFASMPAWPGPAGFARFFADPALGWWHVLDVRLRRAPCRRGVVA